MSEEVISIDPKTMKAIKVGLGIFIVIVCVFMIISPLAGAYNALVDSDLQVQRAASNVQTDLERRADLIPNLAATVKGSADWESKTQYKIFVETAQARAGASLQLKDQIKAAPAAEVAANGVPQEMQLTQLLGNFVKLQEAYPNVQLQSVQQFRDLIAQITATENEILVDRQTYNAAVMQYQSLCKSFPVNLVADHYGFSADRYHSYIPKNSTYAETVPTVAFDFSNL
jgi:LemA protein